MKKYVLALCAMVATFAAASYAELYPAKRFVEFGTNIDVTASENIMPLDEVFQKDLVIDFKKIYNEMGAGGFLLSAGLAPEFYADVSINGFGAGLHTGLSLSGGVGTSKDLFGLLANGMSVGDSVTTSLDVHLQSFLTTSVPIRFKVGALRFKVTPTYFVPLVYLPKPDAKLTVTSNEDGKITANANADFSLYTIVNTDAMFDEEGKFSTSLITNALTADAILSEIGNSGGLDLGVLVELPFPFLSNFDIGGYINVPVIPGHLNHGLTGSATFTGQIDDALGYYTTKNKSDDSDEKPWSYDYNLSDITPLDKSYIVNRPFRLGVDAAWRPLGSWLTVHPRLGVAGRNPFGKDFTFSDSMYMEYSLAAEMTFLYVLGVNVKTEYIDQVFAHSLGLALNLRVFELDVTAGLSNADFVKSFSLSGFEANVGLKFGF